MKSIARRICMRWNHAWRFSGAAFAWIDRLPLLRAGLARHRPFTGHSVYARLGRLTGATVTPRIRNAGGHRLELDLRDLTDLMIFEEIFLDGIYPLDQVPFTPDTVVDCGACAGFFTVLTHGRWPAAVFHAFEPNPANLKKLRQNLALNHITGTVYPAAVGDQAGMAEFSGEGFGGHLADPGEAKTFTVAVADLLQFLREIQPQRLLLKIDIEGAESGLLPKLPPVLPSVTALFLETHHPEPVWREYMQPLLAAGFRHQEIRRRHDILTRTDYVEHVLLRL